MVTAGRLMPRVRGQRESPRGRRQVLQGAPQCDSETCQSGDGRHVLGRRLCPQRRRGARRAGRGRRRRRNGAEPAFAVVQPEAEGEEQDPCGCRRRNLGKSLISTITHN